MWGASPEAFGSHAAQVRGFSGANSARLLLGHRERSASINNKRSRTLEARATESELSSQRLVAATESISSGVVTQEERDEQNFKTAIVIADDTDEDLGDAAGGKEEAKEEAALEHAAATAAEEEKHVEAKDEEDDRAGGTISSFLAAVLGR